MVTPVGLVVVVVVVPGAVPFGEVVVVVVEREAG